MSDLRFERVRRALSTRGKDPPPPSTSQQQAAVALVLRGGAELELLLIKRAVAERDPWSGHMALPGGRRDGTDSSLLETAMRETLEETGVELGPPGLNLGRLSRLDPSSQRLPQLSVTPFVFGVSSETDAHVASREVDTVYWVPLVRLSDPSSSGTYRHEGDGFSRTFPSFDIAGQVVWGLTYRVLEEFLALTMGSPPSRR